MNTVLCGNLLGLLVIVVCVPTLTFAAIPTAGANAAVSSLLYDLSYDENYRLEGYTLVYEPSPTCTKAGVETFSHSHYKARPAAGKALKQLFDSNTDTDLCRAVCLHRGVDRDLVAAVMPHMRYAGTAAGLDDFFRDSCSAMESCLMNYYDKEQPLQVFWIHPQTGDKKSHLQIKYGEQNTKCFNTFLGHEFVAETAQGVAVGRVTIEFETVLAFGESPPHHDADRHKHVEREIVSTLQSEWVRHERVTRTFSPLGFDKGRLPPDVFAYLGAFYYNNRNNKVREEWKGKGVFVNWWETDVYFIQIPWNMKKIVQLRLLEMVEAWAGEPIEETVMYGLRQYVEGARLLTHVDRHVTHAVSLIVNIAQGNLTEPWPVEVQDHADRLHEVVMEPGDVVYYESARALHGRNRPMMGPNAFYVNLFTHYRPIGDDQWYIKPNPPHTPEALVDDNVKGACRLVSKGTTVTAEGQLGTVQAVECDDKRLGKYISPTLFQARGPDDLVEWWRRTDPRQTDYSLDQDDGTAELHAKIDRLTALVEKLNSEKAKDTPSMSTEESKSAPVNGDGEL